MKEKIDSVNPTGSVFREYLPNQRAKAEVADNITTLDKTSRKSANKIVTVYRGAPSNQKAIVAGDFVTTNKQLAKDYAGNGIVLEKKVKMPDLLDDINDPLGQEYIYKPKINIPEKVENLEQEAKKYKSVDEFIKAEISDGEDYRELFTKVYHGGAGVKDISKKGVKILSPEDKLKYPSSGGGYFGLSTSPDKSYAQQFSKNIVNKDDVVELYLNPKAQAYQIFGEAIDDIPFNKLKELAKKYDYIKSLNDNEIRLLTNKAALTKSQLTDIWNKANKTPELKFE